jgi:hypothetical protein
MALIIILLVSVSVLIFSGLLPKPNNMMLASVQLWRRHSQPAALAKQYQI